MNEILDLNSLPSGFSVRAPRPDDAEATREEQEEHHYPGQRGPTPG